MVLIDDENAAVTATPGGCSGSGTCGATTGVLALVGDALDVGARLGSDDAHPARVTTTATVPTTAARPMPPLSRAHTTPRRLPTIPDDTVVPAHIAGSVHPSAQCMPHVGHTHSV